MSYSSVPTFNPNAYITLVSNNLLAVMHPHFLMKCILLFNMVPPVASMPNHYDYDRLPAMHDGQDNKVMWDGIPSPYFIESFYQPLQNALGGVSENGHTLLVTAFENTATEGESEEGSEQEVESEEGVEMEEGGEEDASMDEAQLDDALVEGRTACEEKEAEAAEQAATVAASTACPAYEDERRDYVGVVSEGLIKAVKPAERVGKMRGCTRARSTPTPNAITACQHTETRVHTNRA